MKIKLLQKLLFIIFFIVSLPSVAIEGPLTGPGVKPGPTNGWQMGGAVRSRLTLSQNKVLQGSDGLIYMQVDLEAQDDSRSAVKKRVPTDFVIVLDRSGSMSGLNKMTFAQKAIESLLWQIGENDRFALVTFDDQVETPIPLTPVSGTNRNQFIHTIHAIAPRGSTDIGSGMIQGMNILKQASKNPGQAQRLILISDGMANVGMTDVKDLGRTAGGAVQGEFVISTIGVGLDFDENILSAIADHGTGSYYFLENVAKLDKILADEFYGASRILARNINLRLNLASGFVIDGASGYPVSQQGTDVVVQAGHLYEQQKKSFFVTLRVPTQGTYVETLGNVHLSYEIGMNAYKVALTEPGLSIACLPPDKKDEVKRSINEETFVNAWTRNNYGQFLKEGSGYVSQGDLGSAKASVSQYKDKLEQAYEMAPSPVIANQIAELKGVEEEMNDSFSGADADEKQKRLGKKLHYQSGKEQRVEGK